MKFSKLLNLLFLFLINLFFYFYVFSFFANRASNLLISSLGNFSNDLSKIGFPYADNVSSNFVVFVIAFLNTLLISNFIDTDFYKKRLEKILLEFLKLFLINAGAFTFSLYILRLFNLPRSIILLSIFLYPFLMSLSIFSIGNIRNFRLNKVKVIASVSFFLVIGIIYGISLINFNSTSVSIDRQQEGEDSGLLNFDLGVSVSTNELVCNPWSGSENYISCLYGIEIEEGINVGLQINNISIYKDEIYLVIESGKVLKLENDSYSEFINIEDKVFYKDGGEEGLFDIAFYPNDDDFLISYTNLNNALQVVAYSNYRGQGYEPMRTLVDIPNNQCCHFAGTLDYSEYFEGFLLAVGDMEANNASVLNSESMNTISPRGKILLLSSEEKIYAPIISSVSTYKPPENIVAYGLRNPWQAIEHGDSIIIPDVGNQNIEELNIIDYDSFPDGCDAGVFIGDGEAKVENCLVRTPVSLGWPIFEGPFFSKELNKNTGGDLLLDEENVTELYLWLSGPDTFGNYENEKADEFLINTSREPKVYYNHRPGNDIYRAAIIGGDVISDPSSYYNNFYFFTDYVTLELFAYNLTEDKLYVFPVINSYNTNPTVLKVHPTEKDTLIVALKSGQILNIKLPEVPKLEPEG